VSAGFDSLAARIRGVASGIDWAMGEDETAVEWVAQLRAVADDLLKPRSAEPATPWMEAIARAAANAALLARHFHDADEAVEAAVREAMTTPPPSGPGGPNDG
jgi:hypothetical protein